MTFETLGLAPVLTRALADSGYTEATPVQAQGIPAAMAGHDLMVSSRTGSGKTASFVLPALMRVLQARQAQGHLAVAPIANAQPDLSSRAAQAAHAGPAAEHRTPGAFGRQGGNGAQGARGQRFNKPTGPRVLVLCPTRELAMQVAKATSMYGRHVPGLAVATVVGGVPYAAQLHALRRPLDILIATPGRLIDHLGAGKLVLDQLELLVLDEADRMLDMGFIDPIHHIAQHTPATRQTMMFSATFAGATGGLAQALLRNPQRIDVASHTDTHADIEQRLHWADDYTHKHSLLEHILTQSGMEQALVFTSTQRDAEALAGRLAEMGHAVDALHGGMPQGRRNRVLQNLRTQRVRVLVATDVAARGIDVPTISHVINFGLPMKEEDYVHRIGRTGRAGRSGLAVTLAERRDYGMIQRIQRYTTQNMPVATIVGLEPRRPEPRPAPAKAAPRPGHGKPARPGFAGGPKPFAPRGARPGGPNKSFGHGAKPGGRPAGPRPAR